MFVLMLPFLALAAQAPGARPAMPAPEAHTAWGDFDGDGLRDLFVFGSVAGDRLLRNRGDGGFDDVTAFCGLDSDVSSRNAVWADLDGDGWLDLHLACDPAPGKLLRNTGAGFEDVTDVAGLAGLAAAVTGASVFDYDGDGRLDLELQTRLGAHLFHNEGELSFDPVSLVAPVGSVIPAGSAVPVVNGTTAASPAASLATGNATGAKGGAVDAPERSPGAGVAGGDGGRIGISVSSATKIGGSPVAAAGAASCTDTILDQATSSCVQASSTPTMGALYPLGPELNIDSATGNVGVGTTTPGHRLHVESTANSEAAVYGRNSAVGTPTTIGVQGVSDTVSGRGVHGSATAVSGSTIGVYGLANSPTGRGVVGQNTQSAGDAYGVLGISDSTEGSSVRGLATAVTGTPRGVHGSTVAPGGTGVFGEASSSLGRGVYGANSAGDGILGECTSGMDDAGVRGLSATNPHFGIGGWFTGGWIGAAGRALLTGTGERRGGDFKASGGDSGNSGILATGTSASTAPAYGVRGSAASGFGNAYGIYGTAITTTSHNTYGVYGSSYDYGVYGEADDPLPHDSFAIGVLGRSTGSTGVAGTVNSTHAFFWPDAGVSGVNVSTTARGVVGCTTSTTGETYGVLGQSVSSSAGAGVRGEGLFGVWGVGDAIGVVAQSDASSNGVGVQGIAGGTQSAGVAGVANSASALFISDSGVSGINDSSSGTGVAGLNQATTGDSVGVLGASSGLFGGLGVRGLRGGAMGYPGGVQFWPAGVHGASGNGNGMGVFGTVTASAGSGTGPAVMGFTAPANPPTSDIWIRSLTGVHGVSTWTNGVGVSATVTGSQGSPIGVEGTVYGVPGSGGWGVLGYAQSSQAVGVVGENVDPNPLATAVLALGNSAVTGTKSFAHPHPSDPGKEIRYVSLEGNESGTYFRGKVELVGGRAVVDVPEDFRMVTEPEGLTVQLTVIGQAQVWVESYGLDRIVIRGAPDAQVHYFVNGVRHGYGDFEPVMRNVCFVPRERGVPFGTQYPEAVRDRLVQSGIVNPDSTPNEATAAAHGWRLSDPETTRPRRVVADPVSAAQAGAGRPQTATVEGVGPASRVGEHPRRVPAPQGARVPAPPERR